MIEVRLMEERDLVAAERASEATFVDAEPRSADAAERWIDRMRFYLGIDPGGCWVATADDAVIGFAFSQNRGEVWYLATYGVVPEYQSSGIGRQLIEATLEHAAGRAGLFSSTTHPGATRRYRIAGFSLHPQMRMVGTVDRATLPAIRNLSEGNADDFEWMDGLDRDLRGAGHGPDHGFMLEQLELIVSRPPIDPGYVYIDAAGRPQLLAAANRGIARKLLWVALAASREHTLINCITTENEWAVDVGLAARLAIGQEGYLCLRGMKPPAPYLASGHFL